MEKTKEILKGVLLVILIPIAHGILSTIGNIFFDLMISEELNMGATDIRAYLMSSMMSYALIVMFSVRFFPNSQVYYIIGIGINIVITCWSMFSLGYPWYYYTELVIAIGIMISFNQVKFSK